MKKNIKYIKIMILICSVLIIANLVILMYDGSTDIPIEQEVQMILDIPVSEFAALSIKNSKMSFGLLQNRDSIEIVSEDDGVYDLSQIRTLIYAMCNISSDRIYDDKENWSKFGFEKSQSELMVITTNNEKYEFLLLSENTLDGRYYMYSKNDDIIFLVSDVIGQFLLSENKDFYAKTIFPIINNTNYTQLDSIKMEFNGKGRNYDIVQKDGSFYINNPINQRVMATNVINQLIIYISALYADDIIEQNANLQEYGFNDYDIKIDIKFQGIEYSAYILQVDENKVLMANALTKDVYEVTQPNFDILMQDYIELLNGRAYQYAMGDVEEVEVIIDNINTKIVFEQHKQGITAKIQGEVIEDNELIELINKINSITIEKELNEEVKVNEDIVMNFKFTDGKVDKIILSKTDENGYYLTINNITNFMVTSDSVDDWITWIERH